MTLRFHTHPGRWERQLQRRHHNPLFGVPPPTVSRGELERARSRDQQESKQFRKEMETLFEEAIRLEPNEESGVILRLKERLDQAYERAAGLAGGEPALRDAIRRLTSVIMQAVRRGAGRDPQALQELAEEEEARALHFELLERPLVADLLAPDSPVSADELLPTLLDAEPDALDAALKLFDPEQLDQLAQDGAALLGSGIGDPAVLARARHGLERLRAAAGRHGPESWLS
jgi:hypothetical protein